MLCYPGVTQTPLRTGCVFEPKAATFVTFHSVSTDAEKMRIYDTNELYMIYIYIWKNRYSKYMSCHVFYSCSGVQVKSFKKYFVEERNQDNESTAMVYDRLF